MHDILMYMTIEYIYLGLRRSMDFTTYYHDLHVNISFSMSLFVTLIT